VEISPGSFGRTSEGYMRLRLDLANLSLGEREVHNVVGSFWIYGVELIQQSASQSSDLNFGGKRSLEYPINFSILSQRSDTQFVEWLVVPPKPGQNGGIGWSFVSTETNWDSGTVTIVNDAAGPRLQGPRQ